MCHILEKQPLFPGKCLKRLHHILIMAFADLNGFSGLHNQQPVSLIQQPNLFHIDDIALMTPDKPIVGKGGENIVQHAVEFKGLLLGVQQYDPLAAFKAGYIPVIDPHLHISGLYIEIGRWKQLLIPAPDQCLPQSLRIRTGQQVGGPVRQKSIDIRCRTTEKDNGHGSTGSPDQLCVLQAVGILMV